jgi:hypothetical protein
MSEEISKSIAWNTRLEEWFASTGEKAHCLAWIHKQAEAICSRQRTMIDLPVIILSGIVGFMSVGSKSIFQNQDTFASIGLGVGSLFVSVLNTIGSYFQYAKRAEGHRIASIQYAKLYRFLNIEMSLPRDERMSPYELLKYTREAYDRLQEISPLVPQEVLDQFRKKFEDEKEISKPEEANGLERIVIFPEAPESSFDSPVSIAPRIEPLLERQMLSPQRRKSLLKVTEEVKTNSELGSQHDHSSTEQQKSQQQSSEASKSS